MTDEMTSAPLAATRASTAASQKLVLRWPSGEGHEVAAVAMSFRELRDHAEGRLEGLSARVVKEGQERALVVWGLPASPLSILEGRHEAAGRLAVIADTNASLSEVEASLRRIFGVELEARRVH